MVSCSIASLDSAHGNGQDGEGVNIRLLTVKKSASKFNSALWLCIKDDASYSNNVEENKYDNDEKEILNITSSRLDPKDPYIQDKYKFKDKKTGAITYGTNLPQGKSSPIINFREKLLENKYPINDNSNYWIPIGLGQSIEASPSVTDCDVSLMPVFPVTFLEPSGKKLQHLRNGYIYIYMNGFLWREIYVVSFERYLGFEEARARQSNRLDWTFYDINIATTQGDDIRNTSATIQGQKAVIVFPRKIGAQKPKFEVCFSEQQWTWDYICRMGGMDKDNDPRYIKDYFKNKLHANVTVDETLRKSRLQIIDLNAYNNLDKTEGDVRKNYLMPVKQAAKENNESEEVMEDPTLRVRLHHLLKSGGKNSDKEFVDSDLPVLVLLDPLRIAWQLRSKFLSEYYYMVDWNQKANTDNSAGNGASLQKEVTIARYVSAILKGNEQLNIDKKLVKLGYEGVIDYYDQTQEKLNEKCEVAAEALVEYLAKEREEKTEDYINSVDAALCDFEIDHLKDDETKSVVATGAMEYWTDLLDQINDTEAMQSFLEDELDINTSISIRVLGIVQTASLTKQVKKDLDNRKNNIQVKYNSLKGKVAVQKNLEETYNVSARAHSLIGNFVNIFSRVLNSKLKKVFSATNKLDKESSKQIIKTLGQLRITGQMNMDNLLGTLSRIYNKSMTLETITYKDLQLAIIANKKMNQAGTLLAITPRSGFPQSNIVQLHIDGHPVPALEQVKDFGKKYVLDMGTNIIVFMQVMSTAMAWQQLVSKGVTTKQDVIKLFDTSFKTINLAATVLKMAVDYSVRKELELMQHQKTLTNLFYGKVSGQKLVGELLGSIATLASIGSSIMGMMADLENADKEILRGDEELASRFTDSARLNKFSAISTGILLVSTVGINLLGITTGLAGMVFAVIPIIGWVIAIVVAIAMYSVAKDIANLALTPIERWLKHCYWGTVPYETYDLTKDHWVVTDYSQLKDNFNKELEVISEYLYSFSVRSVWIYKNKNVVEGVGPDPFRRTYKKSLVVDVILTNYIDSGRVYLEVTSKGLDGVTKGNKEPKVLYSDYATIVDNKKSTANTSKDNIFNMPISTIKRFDYVPTLPSNPSTKPTSKVVKSKTIRFTIDEKYIEDNTHQINTKIVFDPVGGGDPLIPNFDGLNLEIIKRDKGIGRISRGSSLKEYRKDQKLDHNRNRHLEMLFPEKENDI